MKKKLKPLLALLGIITLTIGCIAIGAKQVTKQSITAQQPTDTIPPILSEKRISENGISYIIDTTRCRLTPEQFIQQYPKWLGLGKFGALEIDTLATKYVKGNDKYGYEWAYSYRHYFKGIPAGGAIGIGTANNFVVHIGNWLQPISDTVDISAKYSPRQVQDIVADIIRREGKSDVVHLVPEIKKLPHRKATPEDFIQNDSVIATVGLGELFVQSQPINNVRYRVMVWFSDDGDIIVDRTISFMIDPQTGQILSMYEHRLGVHIDFTCVEACSGSACIGGITATLAPESDCSSPIQPLYNDCGNPFNEQVNLAVPTIGNKSAICPPAPPIPELYDDVVTCRDLNLTRQNTCNTGEYNYALYKTSTPQIHAYYYQAAVGTEADLYQGEHVTFKGNSDYIFQNDVLSATSAYWALDIAQNYFATKGINSYDNAGSPIEVVVGRPNVMAQWTQYVSWPGSPPLFPPTFVKQMYIKNIIDDPDFEYAKPNVLIHEYGHAVLANYFQVVDGSHVIFETSSEPSQLAQDETAALHEGIADIFAVLIMDKARQDGILCNSSAEQDKRWLMKVDQLSSRRLDNPALTQNYFGIGQADYYNSSAYNSVLSNPLYTSYLPYYRAGIIAYWFYLATEGSATPIGGISDICGLDINTMTDVLFATLEKCRVENDVNGYTPTFEQFCQKSIDAINDFTVPETEKCQIRRCVLKAWKAVGLGLTIPGGKTDQTQDDETPCFIDLRMRDNDWDTGQEPNYSAGVDGDFDDDEIWEIDSPDDWEDIWYSPDLWNCDEDENCPPTELHNPRATVVNKLGFTIYNAHPDLVSDPAQLHLYYTLANTGEAWPYQWNDYSYQTFDLDWCYVGDEIVNSPVAIPAIDPQTTHTSWVSWSPPNFVNDLYPFYADPDDCGLSTEIDPADGEPKYEMCLLARLESEQDPIINAEESASTRDIVLNSNNTVTRNTFLIDPALGPGGGLPPIVPGQPSIILVANNNDEVRNLDILFDKFTSGSIEALTNILEISFVLSPELWEKWQSTGAQGEGIQEIDTREVKITNMETAKLLDIPFDPREFQPFAIKVTILTSSGKRETLNYLPEEFGFRITHRSSDGSPINKPSNCLFYVNDLNKQTQTAQLFTDRLHCSPNPFSSSMNVQFYLAKAEAVTLGLYDLQGRLVKTIQSNTILAAGTHHIALESQNLSNGIYICSLITETKQLNEKVVLVR